MILVNSMYQLLLQKYHYHPLFQADFKGCSSKLINACMWWKTVYACVYYACIINQKVTFKKLIIHLYDCASCDETVKCIVVCSSICEYGIHITCI